jgi:hypothetical protein
MTSFHLMFFLFPPRRHTPPRHHCVRYRLGFFRPKCPVILWEAFVCLAISLPVFRDESDSNSAYASSLSGILPIQNLLSSTACHDNCPYQHIMILTDISSGNARLVLRVYFLIFVGLITWLADGVLQSRAQLKIIQHGSIRVHTALGWLQGFQLVKSVWELRQLPGGILGYSVMVILFVTFKGH